MHPKCFLVKWNSQVTEGHLPKKPLDQVREAIRLKSLLLSHRAAYVARAQRHIYFHDVRHSSEMDDYKFEAFLTHLAVKEHFAAST